MPQDRSSGAVANIWGRKTAALIAKEIGTEIKQKNSNECMYCNKRVVIKCANQSNNQIGVTYKMLSRIDDVLGAFRNPAGYFELWSISNSEYKKHMRPTGSVGSSAGKVGVINKSVFEENGVFIRRVKI